MKVLITGPWQEASNNYSCLFDQISVPASLIQPGVLRCYCPGERGPGPRGTLSELSHRSGPHPLRCEQVGPGCAVITASIPLMGPVWDRDRDRRGLWAMRGRCTQTGRSGSSNLPALTGCGSWWELGRWRPHRSCVRSEVASAAHGPLSCALTAQANRIREPRPWVHRASPLGRRAVRGLVGDGGGDVKLRPIHTSSLGV